MLSFFFFFFKEKLCICPKSNAHMWLVWVGGFFYFFAFVSFCLIGWFYVFLFFPPLLFSSSITLARGGDHRVELYKVSGCLWCPNNCINTSDVHRVEKTAPKSPLPTGTGLGALSVL